MKIKIKKIISFYFIPAYQSRVNRQNPLTEGYLFRDKLKQDKTTTLL